MMTVSCGQQGSSSWYTRCFPKIRTLLIKSRLPASLVKKTKGTQRAGSPRSPPPCFDWAWAWVGSLSEKWTSEE